VSASWEAEDGQPEPEERGIYCPGSLVSPSSYYTGCFSRNQGDRYFEKLLWQTFIAGIVEARKLPEAKEKK